MDFPATVAPLILRGVTLASADSAYCPIAERNAAWESLANEWDPKKLAPLTRTIGLVEAIPAASELLEGKVRGRPVVDVNG